MEAILGWGSPIGIAILIVSFGLFIFLASFAGKWSRKDKDR
jgi:hypothetical protein